MSEMSAPAEKARPAPVSTAQPTLLIALCLCDGCGELFQKLLRQRVELLGPVQREEQNAPAAFDEHETARKTRRQACSSLVAP